MSVSTEKNISIHDLFDYKRFLNRWDIIPMIFYFPFGVFLLVIRVFIGLQVLIASSLLPKTSTIRLFVIRTMSAVLGFIVREEDVNEKCKTGVKVLVSNHVTHFDHWAVELVLPCVVPSMWDLPEYLNHCLGFYDFGVKEGREVFTRNVKNYLSSNAVPILTHPEGASTNGHRGLLKFNSWPFSFEPVVHPIVISVNRLPPIKVTPSVLGSRWWSDLFWLLLTPCTVFTVRYLQPAKKQENESVNDFSRRVQKEMANAMKVVATSYTDMDKFEYAKRLSHPFNDSVMQPPPSNWMSSYNSGLQPEEIEEKEVSPQVAVDEISRKQCAFEAAILFARDENQKGVSAILSQHNDELLKHWLNIVSNFPETMSPINYQSLLPKFSKTEGEDTVSKLSFLSCNQEDFDLNHSLSAYSSSTEPSEFEREFYEENKTLLDFAVPVLTKSLVSSWFHYRARQIDEYSSLINHALKLVEIGIDNNVPNLEKLFDDLDTYSTIVYECLPINAAVMFDFSRFEALSDEQKIEYLMHGALDMPDQFISRIKSHLIPFLRKCEKYSEGVDVFYCYLSNYVTSIAKNDLVMCSLIFEKKDSQNKNLVIEDKEHLLSLAVECIYACEQTNQLQAACTIIESLPPREEDSTFKYAPFYERLDLLDKHLGVADLLEEYNCFVTVKEVRDMQMDKNGEEIKRLITQITRLGAKKSEPYFKEKEWFQMFNDLLEMREDCFEDCITLDEIYEIFVNALLTSGRKENFGLASSYMQLINDPSVIRKKKLIPFKKSVEILVSAARDYTNSANSISDNVIDLAKECLLLISDVEKCENEMVREEMAFLEALDMLYKEFNVKLLPIQIRLIQQPKLELLSEILSDDLRAYRRWRKLLKVCELLRVCKNDDEKVRNGKILTLVGGFAYAAEDLKECVNICNFVMNNEYVSGCGLCKKLAFSDFFDDDEVKLDLLVFVLSYCDDKTGEEMENILDKIREIKVKLKLRNQLVAGPEKKLVDFGVNQVSKSAQKLSSWISSLGSFKK